jgi:hypothetical protein
MLGRSPAAGDAHRAGIAYKSVNIVDELHAIAAALRGAGIPYAVCGGIAVTAYGAPRSTKGPMIFGAGTTRERHVQRVNKIVGSEHLALDLWIAETAYAGVLDDRVDVELPAGLITFVSRDTLIRMKRMAGRPIDAARARRADALPARRIAVVDPGEVRSDRAFRSRAIWPCARSNRTSLMVLLPARNNLRVGSPIASSTTVAG